MPKTTKEIINESFKNQEFNVKNNYENITNVFDTIDFIDDCNDLWFSQSDVDEIKKKLKEAVKLKIFDMKYKDKTMDEVIDSVFDKVTKK